MIFELYVKTELAFLGQVLTNVPMTQMISSFLSVVVAGGVKSVIVDEVTSDKMATILPHHPGVFKETKTPPSVLGGCSDVQEEDMARVEAHSLVVRSRTDEICAQNYYTNLKRQHRIIEKILV